MIVIKDSMVVIHLAKVTLLERSCEYFKRILIPKLVKEEVLKKEKPDSVLISQLIAKKKIIVKDIKDKTLVKKANEFNIFRGEAEVVALYWQESADYIATDDDNVRNKSLLLGLRIIGTPSILLTLYKKNVIDKEKIINCVVKLKEIGWFSNGVLDKMIMEVD